MQIQRCMEIEARESLADESWSASLDQLHASNLRSLRIGEEKKRKKKKPQLQNIIACPLLCMGCHKK